MDGWGGAVGVKRGKAVGRQVRRVPHQDFFRDQREVKGRSPKDSKV